MVLGLIDLSAKKTKSTDKDLSVAMIIDSHMQSRVLLYESKVIKEFLLLMFIADLRIQKSVPPRSAYTKMV